MDSIYLFKIWIASLASSESLNLFLKILCFIWEIINFNLKGIYDLVIYVDITLTWIWTYILFYHHGNVKFALEIPNTVSYENSKMGSNTLTFTI